MTSEKPTETRYLPPADVRLWSLPDGAMVLKCSGERRVLGAPKRALPLSEPERFIVLYDAEGLEVGSVRDVSELDEESQAVLRDALKRAYRVERITRILEVEREPLSGQTRWRVELADEDAPEDGHAALMDAKTDAKPDSKARSVVVPAMKKLLRRDDAEDVETFSADVQTREREFFIAGAEDVATARYPHIYIVDTDRNRYEIPNCETLDADSRSAAERFF